MFKQKLYSLILFASTLRLTASRVFRCLKPILRSLVHRPYNIIFVLISRPSLLSALISVYNALVSQVYSYTRTYTREHQPERVSTVCSEFHQLAAISFFVSTGHILFGNIARLRTVRLATSRHYRFAAMIIFSITLLTTVGLSLAKPIASDAVASSTINFQARLETSAGSIASDGNYNVEFKLYSASSGGTALWTEDYLDSASQGIATANGYLTANLGSITAFPSTIPWGSNLYLTMNIGGTSTGTPTWDGEMTPRLLLTAVPYAFAAQTANQLQTTNGSNVATLTQTTPTGTDSIVLPDASGTVCLSSSNCSNYIQNGSALQTGSNLHIQSTAAGTATAVLQALSGQTANLLQLSNSSGVAVGGFNASGQLYYQSGSYTGTLIQNSLGQSTSYYLPDPGAASATICISTGNCGGTTNTGTANYVARYGTSTSLSASTLLYDNGSFIGVGTTTNSALLSVGGTLSVSGTLTVNNNAVIKTGSTTAFQVQNTNGSSILSVDSVNDAENINGGININQVAAPTALTATASATAGSPNGTYYYVVNYITPSGATNFGTVSSAVTASSLQINLSNIPTSTSSLVTARNIYRTVAGGASTGPFYLDGTISDNTTTTYTDNVADGSLGAAASDLNRTTSIMLNGTSIINETASNNNELFGTNDANLTIGLNDTGLGTNALSHVTTGNSNTAFGPNALSTDTTGSGDIAIGTNALINVNASYNVAIGTNSMQATTGGIYNVGVGYSTLAGDIAGNSNVAIGNQAGLVDNASSNVFLGSNSGFTTTGSGDVFLGANAGYNETGSNLLYVANTTTSTPLIYGNFSTQALTVYGSQNTINQTAGTVAHVIQGAASQTADLLDLDNSGGTPLAKIDASGNITTSGNLILSNSSHTTTITSGSLSSNIVLTLPTITGTLCTTSTCATGSYIQNGTSSQAGNFYVSASAGIAGTVQGASDGSNILVIRNSAGSLTDSFDASGNLTVDHQINSIFTTNSVSSYGISSQLTDTAATGSTSLNGIQTTLTGTATTGTNTLNAVRLSSVSPVANNVFNGFSVGTGYNSLLVYNSTTLISGTGLLQNIALDPTLDYTDITGTGALTAGSLATGFGVINTANNITTSAAIQGGSLTATGTAAIQGAGGLTVGVVGTTTGSLTIASSHASGSFTFQASASQSSAVTLTIPADAVSDTVCLLTLANCGSAGGGVTTIGGLDGGTVSANGAAISGTTLYLQSASISNAGLINTTTQSFIGAKTFTSNLTINATAPSVSNGAEIAISGNLTNASYNQSGIYSAPNVAPTAASTAFYTGLTFIPLSNSNNLTSGSLAGLYGGADYYGTGTVGNLYGGYLQNQLTGAGTVTNSYGLYVDNASKSAGTIANNYGLYLQAQSSGTNNYTLYSNGGVNYFGGNVDVGGTFTSKASLTVASASTVQSALYLQEAASGTTATAVIQDASSQSGDLLDLENNANAVVAKFDDYGNLTAQSGNFSGLVGVTGTLNVQSASSAYDVAVLGSNLFGGFATATGWTIGGSGASETDVAANSSTTVTASPTITPVVGNYYQLSYTVSGYSGSGSVSAQAGGLFGTVEVGNTTMYTQVFKATATANLSFVPTNFTGTISAISLEQLTTASATLSVANSSGTVQLEIRTGTSGSGTGTTFVGLSAGLNNTASGVQDSAFGAYALQSNTTGTYDTATGSYALEYNSNGIQNSAFGAFALQDNTSGNFNTAVGTYSLVDDNSGSQNTAVGESSLASDTTGSFDVGIGTNALQDNTTASYNTAVGTYSLIDDTTGSANSALGINALAPDTTGSDNTAVGANTLQVTTGSNDTSLGYNSFDQDATSSFTSLATIQNATAIGSYAQVQESNAIVLGGIDTPTVVGIGTTIPLNTLSVSAVDYSTGTAAVTAAGTTVTGTGTSWTSSEVGEQFNFADGQTGIITAVASSTSLSLSVTQPITGVEAYRIQHTGFQVTALGTAYLQQSSTTAFQIENTAGAPIFLVNTTSSGNNLLTYPGFESGSFTSAANGWAPAAGGGTIAQNSTVSNAYNGLYSLKLTTTATSGQGAQTSAFTQSVAAGTYVVSFEVKVTVAMNASNFIITLNDGTTHTCSPASQTLNLTGFVRVYCSTTTVNPLTSLTIAQNVATANVMYIDAVQLQLGTTPTAYQVGSIQLRGIINNPVNITPTSNSTSTFEIENASSFNVFNVDTLGSIVSIGINTSTNATQTLLQLNSYDAYADTPATCSTTTQQGAMYYNSYTNAIRSCINGSWQDLLSTAGLGTLLYGVVDATGAAAGDIESTTTSNVSGPCKVSWASATTVNIQACTVYSGGRQIVQAYVTVTLPAMAINTYTHLCYYNAGAAGPITNSTVWFTSANVSETANLPTFSASAPIVCLATIKNSASTANTIAQISDTRVFNTSTKEFVESTVAVAPGWAVITNATNTTQVTTTATAATAGVAGVVVTGNATAWSSGGPNAIIAVNGPVEIEATAGATTAYNYIETGATAGYVTPVTTLSGSLTYNLYMGLARTTYGSCSTPSAATCQGSLLTYEQLSGD